MSFSQHYNWYQIKSVLCESFGCILKYNQIGILVFECGDRKTIFSKSNNMSRDFVEEILKPLDITMKEFEENFKMVFHT